MNRATGCLALIVYGLHVCLTGITYAAYPETPAGVVQGGGYDGWDMSLSAAARLDGPNVRLSSGTDQVLSARADAAGLALLTLIESDNAYPALTNGAVLTLAFPEGWAVQWNTNNLTYGGDAASKVAWPTAIIGGRRLRMAVIADFNAGETLLLGGLAADKLPSSRQGSGRIRLDYNDDGLWNEFDEYTVTIQMVAPGGHYDGWDMNLSAPATLDGPNVRVSSDAEQVLNALSDAADLAALTLIESDNEYRALTSGAVLTLAFPAGLDLRWNIDALSYSGTAAGKVGWPALAQSDRRLEIVVTSDFDADESLTLSGLRAEDLSGSRQGTGRIRLDYSADGTWNVYDSHTLTVGMLWPGGRRDGWDANRSQAVEIYPVGSMFLFR